MMLQSYTNKYFKIYFWQVFSIILNFVSLFIVTPKLASQPLIYGTYIVCISATIFLSYADLGFLSACFKYASESYASKNVEREIKLTAFGAFILFLVVLIIALVFFYLSLKPQILISDIKDKSEINVASKLLLILSCFSFNIVFQRILQLIFGIRLEDYIFQRITIVSALIKILSVFYFFDKNSYNIVGYFLFSQILGVIVSIVGVFLIKINYRYNFKLFIKNFSFSSELFAQTRKIAFGTLYVTIMWILYYEIDSFVIAKYLGAQNVAYFAIGFSLLTAFRTIFGALYAPFSARFNHFVGSNDINSLNSFFLNVISITLPFVLFPVLTLVLFMKSFVFSWVGSDYLISVNLASFLILSYLLSYISYPAGILIIAMEKVKKLYIVNTIIAVSYWLGIIFTISTWGVLSFGFFKFIAFIIAGGFYISYSSELIGIKTIKFMKKVFLPAIIPVGFILLSLLINNFLPMEMARINLFCVTIVVGFISFIATGIYYFTCNTFKNYVKKAVLISFKGLKQ